MAENAIEAYERARAAELLDSGITLYLGDGYAMAGRSADSRTEFERGLKRGCKLDEPPGRVPLLPLSSAKSR